MNQHHLMSLYRITTDKLAPVSRNTFAAVTGKIGICDVAFRR